MHRPFSQNLFLKLSTFLILLYSPPQASSLKYPFKADLSVKTILYKWADMTGCSIILNNYDFRSFDSLSVRLYFQAPDGFENDLAARMDICILYREDGFQDQIQSELRTKLFSALVSQHPVKIENTLNVTNGTHAFYLKIPLTGIELRNHSRLRVDIIFDSWEQIRFTDLLGRPPRHTINDTDWTFGPHFVSKGDPIEFSGARMIPKDSIDISPSGIYPNYYATIYRNDELLWGIPPDWEKFYSKDSFIPVKNHQIQALVYARSYLQIRSGSHSGTFQVQTSKPLHEVIVSTISGKVIDRKMSLSKNTSLFNLQHIGTGIYLLKVIFINGEAVTQRFSIVSGR